MHVLGSIVVPGEGGRRFAAVVHLTDRRPPGPRVGLGMDAEASRAAFGPFISITTRGGEESRPIGSRGTRRPRSIGPGPPLHCCRAGESDRTVADPQGTG